MPFVCYNHISCVYPNNAAGCRSPLTTSLIDQKAQSINFSTFFYRFCFFLSLSPPPLCCYLLLSKYLDFKREIFRPTKKLFMFEQQTKKGYYDCCYSVFVLQSDTHTHTKSHFVPQREEKNSNKILWPIQWRSNGRVRKEAARNGW